jgi:hypothetical protein
VNRTKNLANRIRGWFPKEAQLPTLQLHTKPRNLLTKKNILLITIGVIVAMLVSGMVFFVFLINFFNLPNQPKEAQDTVNAYINALNDYNATAAWNLISPSIQASYGTLQNFTGSFVSQLQQSDWHAQIITNDYESGTIAEYCLFQFQNSCHINTYIEISQSNTLLTYKAVSFDLKTYAYSNFQPSDWKINSKFTGS